MTAICVVMRIVGVSGEDTMPKYPTPPRNTSNPVGGARLQQQTVSRLKRGLRDVRRWVLERFEEIPKREITINAQVPGYVVNETRYEYLISADELRLIVEEIRRRLGIEVPPDYMVAQTVLAYEAGTGTAVAQLAALTDDYTREITQVLASEPWQRRVALIRSRVFESMLKVNEGTAIDLGRILSRAVEDGLNPRDVVPMIRSRFRHSEYEAERVARTEIPGALRRATWDENDDARQRLGINTGILWFSALSPTTRASHASRHGKVYTSQEVAEFYSRDGNAIFCKCGNQPVLLDESGQPILGPLKERMQKQRAKFEPGEGV
jgi:SPP1 gp7 family putative phage head morphogenesis protein